MKHCRITPSAVTMCLEKKSHCHRLLACALRKSAQVPLVGSVFGSNSFSLRMLMTVVRQIFVIPSFFNSPRMRV
jgi:hypothetical protein